MRDHRSEALRGVNAELNYQQAIDDARKSLKENGKTVDETTNKGRDNLRALYALADGWNAQSNAAKNAKGSLEAARKNFIDTATDMGMAEEGARKLANRLFEIPPKRKTEIVVESDAAEAALDRLNRFQFAPKVIAVRVQAHGATEGGGFPAGADGMTVPGPRYPYGDKTLIIAAPGEEIITNRLGQADRFRSDRASGRIPSYADGGSIYGTYTSRRDADAGPVWLLADAADAAGRGLKGLKSQLDKHEKALDRETSALESLTSQRDTLSSSATSSLLHDPFGNGLVGFHAQNAADAADAHAMLAALQTLVRNGLDPKGALFQRLAASGDVTTAQQLAALTSAQLFAEQALFNQAQGPQRRWASSPASRRSGHSSPTPRRRQRVPDRGAAPAAGAEPPPQRRQGRRARRRLPRRVDGYDGRARERDRRTASFARTVVACDVPGD